MISGFDVDRRPELDVDTAPLQVASWFVNAASVEAFVLPMSWGPLYEVHSGRNRLVLQGKRDQFCRLVTQFSSKEMWWNNQLRTDLSGRVLWMSKNL